MPAFLRFGKIIIGIDWIFIKIAIIIASIAFLFTSLIWIAIPILLYIGYSIIHEFIHALAVKIYGGNIKQIFLGYPLSFVDFQMPSIKTEKGVYGWGAFADLVIMVLIFLSLFQGWITTENYVLYGLMIIFVIILGTGELLPSRSDLSEYFKRYK